MHLFSHRPLAVSPRRPLAPSPRRRVAASRYLPLAVALAFLLFGALARNACAYIEAPYSLGKVIEDSTGIAVLRVESVDRTNNVITFRKVEILKGKSSVDVVKANIAHAGFNPREWQCVMAWAAEGKTAVIFHNESACEICIDNYWFQCYLRRGSPEWWDMSHGEPYLLRTYCGKPADIAQAVRAMIKGEEVIVPGMVDGDKNAIALRTARIQRLRASLKLLDYNAARDFAGWGGQEVRPVLDMPAFQQVGMLPQLEGAAGWGIVTGPLQVADRSDLVLFAEDQVAVLQNLGQGSFERLDLPQGGGAAKIGGARAAAIADYNQSGKGSILLATPSGPRLFTSLGNSQMRDDSASIPPRPYWALTAATWINLDGTTKHPAMLLADRFAGLRLLKNKTPAPTADQPASAPAAPAFEDISDAAGLGAQGLTAGAGSAQITQLLLADLNADGSPELLATAADGRVFILALHDGKFSQLAELSLPAGSHVAIADLNADGAPDLVAVSPAGSRVLQNDGKAHFRDITSSSGLAAVNGSAVLFVPRPDLNEKAPDLLVACVDGPNRYFRNNGHAVFTETTTDLGLDRRIFNSRALAALPATGGRVGPGDLVLVNQGQPSVVLIWKR